MEEIVLSLNIKGQFVIKIVYGTMPKLGRIYPFCILFVDLFTAKLVRIIIIAVETKKGKVTYNKRRNDTFVDFIVYC